MKSNRSRRDPLLVMVLSLLVAPVASAGSATWILNTANADWNAAANSRPATVLFFGENNYAVSFKGGDGNDFTLTVLQTDTKTEK